MPRNRGDVLRDGALIDGFGWQAALLISAAMTLVVALVWTYCSPTSSPIADEKRVPAEAGLQRRVLLSRGAYSSR